MAFERNSRRSRILAAANIRVARAHVNKPCDSIEWQYQNMQRVYSSRELSGEVWHLLRHGGRSTYEVIERRKGGNGLEVPCRYRFAAKRRLIKKLEGLLQNQVTASYNYSFGFLLITQSLINAALD